MIDAASPARTIVHTSELEGFDDYFIDPSLVVGSWANRTRVYRDKEQFTIDFIRDVPDHSRGVIVVRAVVSPPLGAELRDQLENAWREYYESSMPEDIR